MKNLIKNELLENEELLWIGKPNPKIIFAPSDIFLVPFSLL